MRKLIILFLAVSLFAACNNDKGKVNRDDRRSDRDKDDYRDRDDNSGDKDKDTKSTDYTDDREKTNDDNNDKSGGWPKAEREDFVSSCVTEAVKAGQTRSISQRYCDCMLEKMESLYPDVYEVAKLTEDDINRVVGKYKDKCLE